MLEKILIVDDEATSLKVVQLVLESSGYATATAKSGEEAFQLAFSFHPDLIILDVNMPGGWSGFETCKNFKACSEFVSLPIIFLTAKTDQLEEGFNIGGADYLLKPLNQQELIVRTRFHLKMRSLVKQAQQTNDCLETKVQERIQDLTQTNRKLNQVINERKLLEKRLKFEVGTDFLTQLASGVAFESQLQNLINHQTNEQSGALLFIDLFEFEHINQSYGWEAGDHFLINISQLLLSQLKDSALVGRLGGDQFAVYLPDTNLSSAKTTARALVDCISNLPIKWQEQKIQCGVCIGFYIVDNTESSARKAVSKAIQASVIAKEKGIGSVVNYHDKTVGQSLQEANELLQSQIETAINSNQFSLFYQKVLPLNQSTQQQTSIELLLRLKSGVSERLMSPNEFLTVSRKSKLNEKIDFWVVKEAVTWLQNNKLAVEKLSYISINITAETIANPIFLITLENLLTENAVAPKLLCFEISEPDALISINRTRIFLTRLKTLGCQTCIDDFGGQSVIYQYLQELAIDHLKIDGSFIRHLNNNPVNSVLCKMLKDMANITGKTISCKHIEEQSAAIKLSDLGISSAQGNFLHAPEPLTDFEQS
jgi:diguanylate cyclase (GGDEF)-like protein